MLRKTFLLCPIVCVLAGVLLSCSEEPVQDTRTPPPVITPQALPTPTPKPILDPTGGTLGERFNPPPGYDRTERVTGDFGSFLAGLALKEDGAPVLALDGTTVADTPHAAVFALDISKTPLQYGSDVLLRLRAEYLYDDGQLDTISYHFLSGFEFPFSRWIKGQRIEVPDGKNPQWVEKTQPSSDHDTLLAYLNKLFEYSNATAITYDIGAVADVGGIAPGDVYVDDSGSVMVVDVAQNAATGDFVVLLAQAPRPTQEVYILKNSGQPSLSPWFALSADDPLTLPGGASFFPEALKRFNEKPSSSDE